MELTPYSDEDPGNPPLPQALVSITTRGLGGWTHPGVLRRTIWVARLNWGQLCARQHLTPCAISPAQQICHQHVPIQVLRVEEEGFSRAGETCTSCHQTLQLITARPRSTSGQSTSGPPGSVSGCSREKRPDGQTAAGMSCPERRCRGKNSTRLGLVLFHPWHPPVSWKSTASQLAGHAGSCRFCVERHQMVCYETHFGQKIAAVFGSWEDNGSPRGGESRETQLWRSFGIRSGLCS